MSAQALNSSYDILISPACLSEKFPGFSLIGRDPLRLCSDWLYQDVATPAPFNIFFLCMEGKKYPFRCLWHKRDGISNIEISTNQSTVLSDLDQ